MFFLSSMRETVACSRSGSLDALRCFVKDVTPHLRGGMWLLLTGDLGAGKTTFVRALVESVSDISDVTSPTFSVLNLVDLKNSKIANVQQVVHLDLYRLKSGHELNYLGIENFASENTLVVMEWPEVVEDQEWEDFFSTTGCYFPKQVGVLQISYLAEENAGRSYSARFFEA
jgi:tRNA threonylcarbamoyladenosine biosynthesis protein TsaE